MENKNQYKAEIINIGDELLAGYTLNSNATWMSRELRKIGVITTKHLVIADEKQAIINALDQVDTKTDLVFITGGLGPTDDDRTKAILTSYFNGELVFSEEAYQDIVALFKKRGRVPSTRNRDQAMIPNNASRICNTVGTASGMIFLKNNSRYVVMPGVPNEMQHMMTLSIIPEIARETQVTIGEVQINAFGLAESDIADSIEKVIPNIEKEVTIGYYPSIKGITLRLSGEDHIKLHKIKTKIISLLGNALYSEDGESLQEIVVEMCKNRVLTLATAESCTGGLISNMITDIPGSSEIFKEGFIVYSNEAKITRLGVDAAIIAEFGAVSPQTVEAMAKGLLQKTKADIAVAVSGIAGPGGATPEKPVGLVYIAVAYKDQIYIQDLHFNRGREMNKAYAAHAALNGVRLAIINDETNVGD
jgi:nicotinamide-nucleotide amidase